MHFVYKGNHKDKTNHLSKMKFTPQKTKLHEPQIFFSPHKQLKVIIQLCTQTG